MRTIAEYFKDIREQTPTWLKEFKNGDKPPFSKIFHAGRVVYYPGSEYDGQPIKTFNVAHYSHLFLYVDYQISRERIIEELTKDNALNGYKNIGIVEYQERDLTPNGWTQHYRSSPEEIRDMNHFSRPDDPYCLMFVFERELNLTDEHGCDRFAVITLKADGIATYDALFANNSKAPDVLILQDHGYGGNYSQFGRNGALNQIAKTTNCYPHFLMVADNTAPWEGYEKIPDLQHAYHRYLRWLYRRSER